jgi:hypothetical protein
MEREHLQDLHVKAGDNNKMDLKKIGWEALNLIDLAQGRDMSRVLVHTAMNRRVPYTAEDFLTS